MNLDDQFASLPSAVRASLFGVLDAVSNVGKAGQLQQAGRFLKDLAKHESFPEHSQSIVAKAGSVVTAVSLEEHKRRVAWANAEGYSGVDALLVASGVDPARLDREESEEESEQIADGDSDADESLPSVDTRRAIVHALDLIAAGAESEEMLTVMSAGSLNDVPAGNLAVALALLNGDLLQRWADAEGAPVEAVREGWIAMVRENS